MKINNSTTQYQTLIATLSLLILAFTSAAAQAASPGLYVFGDSLSDAGNVFELTGINAVAPYEPIPSSPYAIGGHHFTDGQTWAEQYAKAIGLINGGKALLKDPAANGNYAFGGARARNTGASPSLTQQVDMFLAANATAPSDAIYVVQFGGNDIRDALVAGPSDGPVLVLEAVATTSANIARLYAAGARKFLVANAPNMGKTPLAASLGATGPAESVSSFYNFVLESGFTPLGIPGLIQLEGSLPGVQIARMDLFGLMNDLVAFPGSYGLSDPYTPCLSFGVAGNAKCDKPAEHLFWDAIHPTRAAHVILAQEAVNASASW